MKFTWLELQEAGFEEELEGISLSLMDGLFEFTANEVERGKFVVEFEHTIVLNLKNLEHLKSFYKCFRCFLNKKEKK